MVRVNERNRRIVEEFRAGGGVVGGHFEGASLLILHTIGRRTGRERSAAHPAGRPDVMSTQAARPPSGT
jgi:hypothetical protein